MPQTLSLNSAYAFGLDKGLEQAIHEIRNMVIEWDSNYTSSLRRGYIVQLFEERGIFEEFKALHWADGNTPEGESMRRRFLRIKADYERFLEGRGDATEEPSNTAVATEESLQFALEAHLRDFLARNLDRVERGLQLYRSGDRDGVEFPVAGGRIDLLAVDAKGKYVVVELKLAQGRNKTLGQLLYYMGWIDKNLGNGPCRGLIVANEITDELAVAVSRVPGVGLARYRMSFALESVTSMAVI